MHWLASITHNKMVVQSKAFRDQFSDVINQFKLTKQETPAVTVTPPVLGLLLCRVGVGLPLCHVAAQEATPTGSPMLMATSSSPADCSALQHVCPMTVELPGSWCSVPVSVVMPYSPPRTRRVTRTSPAPIWCGARITVCEHAPGMALLRTVRTVSVRHGCGSADCHALPAAPWS